MKWFCLIVFCSLSIADALGANPSHLVLDQQVTEELFAEAKAWCQKTLSGYGAVPEQNITVVLEDRKTFAQTLGKRLPAKPESNIIGHTASVKTNGVRKFKISLVTGLTKRVALPTLIHEYGHVWLTLHVRPQRLSQAAKEGFCELLKYKFLVEKDDKFYIEKCLRSSYTEGQIEAFVAAEKAHSLAQIIRWLKEGEGDRIDVKNLAQILVKPRPSVSAPPRSVVADAPVERPVFEGIPVFPPRQYTDLILKGISGSGMRRFALINGVTFAVNEKGRIRIGESNLSLHCLEIQKSSVLIQLEGEPTARTLSLNGAVQ